MRPELELACLRASLALLPRLPAGASLTANLSVPMLSDPRVSALLAEQDSLQLLIIEVTEEALARDDGSMLESLMALRAQGVRFAVDDIGAGYSGLGQLAALAPTYLKLDRSLVQDIDTDPTKRSLVAAMTGYANSIDALLVAEGVETDGELELLASLGVPLIQGYRLARPGAPWPAVDDLPAALPTLATVA
jgi:EAL domain-containing protein (putative c-di-GMP-specific phosphodiesterase class I)